MYSSIKRISMVCVTLFTLVGTAKVIADEGEIRMAMANMIEALNAQDVNQMSTHWTDDIVYDFVAQPPTLSGKQEVAGLYEGVFNGAPDFHSTQNRTLVSGNIMVTETIATGTHLGEISGIPATGNNLQLAPLHIWEFEGDKVKRATEYLDMASMLMQMGLMPAPALDPSLLVPSFPLPDTELTGLTPSEASIEFTSRWNTGDLSGMAKMIHPDANILIAPLGVPLSRDAYIAVGEMMFQGFSEMPMEIVRAIDLGDGWVVTELLITGINDGPYMGMPATRRSIALRAASLQRYNGDGLITDLSSYYDTLTMMAQLGLFPPPDPLANKALEHRVFDEIWNQGLLEVADEVFAPDAILHLGADVVQGPEAFKQYVTEYRTAFPDIFWTVDDQVAEGDIVVTRLTGTGTHQGELMGIPPTGLQVTVTAIATVRIAQGKIQESWSSWDALGLMQQLGVMSPTDDNDSWGVSSEVTGEPGDPITNTSAVLYVVQKFWNEQNVFALDGTHSADSIAHNPVIPGHPLPYPMYKHACLLHLAAFPDFHVTTERIIAEGDKVAIRWTVTGTHMGFLMGVPPTDRPVQFEGATIYRLADAKIVETWWAYDALGMMQQITAPEP